MATVISTPHPIPLVKIKVVLDQDLSSNDDEDSSGLTPTSYAIFDEHGNLTSVVPLNQVRSVFELEVPQGTTHYTGYLPDDMSWWKVKNRHVTIGDKVEKYQHWLYYDAKRKEWMIGGENKPHWINTLSSVLLENYSKVVK